MTTKQEETYRATGRRKCSVSKVILKKGTGKRIINKKDFSVYFPDANTQKMIEQPIETIEDGVKWDIIVSANGGGISGQAGAVRLGISRALVLYNEENRKTLREHNLLTRDSRIVQRKMYGRAKARKRFQFSKR